jgi:hypothetical protein
LLSSRDWPLSVINQSAAYFKAARSRFSADLQSWRNADEAAPVTGMSTASLCESVDNAPQGGGRSADLWANTLFIHRRGKRVIFGYQSVNSG